MKWSPCANSTPARTVVRFQDRVGAGQVGQHRPVERIAFVGPVQADQQDVPIPLEGHRVQYVGEVLAIGTVNPRSGDYAISIIAEVRFSSGRCAVRMYVTFIVAWHYLPIKLAY